MLGVGVRTVRACRDVAANRGDVDRLAIGEQMDRASVVG
jgi:hypothetical protein